MRRVDGAFTLIELLIVVAIIAILAAIAVPNFLEAQIRAKVSRVKADQRSLAVSIESYAVDGNQYPIRRDQWNTTNSRQALPPLLTKILDPAFPNASVGMHMLTTPVAYITSLMSDVFNDPVRHLPPSSGASDAIDYYDPPQTDTLLAAVRNTSSKEGWANGWVLVSVGPDRFIGANSAGNPGGYPPESSLTTFNYRDFYDPSNGTVSRGNIYRFAGDLTQSQFAP